MRTSTLESRAIFPVLSINSPGMILLMVYSARYWICLFRDRKRDWTKYYSSADEFEEYYTGIAKKHGLLHNTHFNHQVLSAEWNDDTGKWKVTIMRNGNPQDTFDDYADFFVNGSGTLKSEPDATLVFIKFAFWHLAANLDILPSRARTLSVEGFSTVHAGIDPSTSKERKFLFLESAVPPHSLSHQSLKMWTACSWLR